MQYRILRALRALILKFGGDLSGKFRRRLGTETTWLDLERPSRLSRLNGGDSQVYSSFVLSGRLGWRHGLIWPLIGWPYLQMVIHLSMCMRCGSLVVKSMTITLFTQWRRHPIYTLRLYTVAGVRHHGLTSYIIYSCNIFGLNSFTLLLTKITTPSNGRPRSIPVSTSDIAELPKKMWSTKWLSNKFAGVSQCSWSKIRLGLYCTIAQLHDRSMHSLA